ncbi:TetR family transcriptional regulator C-terminal domain-containing protein [Streptomyces globisporus]|uniref:TetR family transcriptional regulator C-terminal domain-containing protein n=1 Tax=Streptomyces globisporus TaxID=1908 RepID=UPI00373AE521
MAGVGQFLRCPPHHGADVGGDLLPAAVEEGGQLGVDARGLPAVTEFFTGLIETRCTGEFARWGCMVSNAHAGTENVDPAVRAILDRQHQRLRTALHAALLSARRQGQLAEDVDPDSAADVLALLAHGVNLRSRAGADARQLHRTVAAAIAAVARGA